MQANRNAMLVAIMIEAHTECNGTFVHTMNVRCYQIGVLFSFR